jgi:hypothetical protein
MRRARTLSTSKRRRGDLPTTRYNVGMCVLYFPWVEAHHHGLDGYLIMLDESEQPAMHSPHIMTASTVSPKLSSRVCITSHLSLTWQFCFTNGYSIGDYIAPPHRDQFILC